MTKRLFDIIISLFVLIGLLWWLIPLLALLSFIETRTFPFFVQKRIGFNNRVFNCYKIRTMYKNDLGNILPTQINDLRVTKTGRLMRNLGFDELPQFVNVLIGDMSIVGPRPYMFVDNQKFSEQIPDFNSRLVNTKPGITGLAQSLGYRGFVGNYRDIYQRYRLDIWYKKRQSLKLDLYILYQTFFQILKSAR